jgi:hypothetical protein
MGLSEGVVPIAAQLLDVDHGAREPLTATAATELQALGAPEDLIRDAAVAAALPDSDAAGEVLDRVADFVEPLRRDEGEIVSVETVYRRVRVLGCSAPSTAEAKVTATLGLAAAAEGGLKLTLGGFGLEGSVKFAVTQDIKLACTAGEDTKLAYILVPLTREVRMWRPPGAGESFPVARLVPIKDASRFGLAVTKGTPGELLAEARRDGVPLQGDTSFSGATSLKLETSWSVELTVGTKENNVGLSVGISAAVEQAVDYELPAGSFQLRWLSGPLGAVVLATS